MENMETIDSLESMENIASLGHPKGISKATAKETIVAQELIELIGFDEAPVYKNPKTLINALDIPDRDRKAPKRFYKISFRLDYEGRDKDKTFARYTIQYENKTFAQIHIKISLKCGAKKIQKSFLESLNTASKDVYVTE
jgi:hypothetical protein